MLHVSFMTLFKLFTLFITFFINVQSQIKQGGISPTQRMTSIPSIIIESSTLRPTQSGYGNMFINSTNFSQYKYSMTFEKQMPNVIHHNIITSSLQSYINVHLGYNITSNITQSNTKLQTKLIIYGKSVFFLFKISSIRLSEQLWQSNLYITIHEVISNNSNALSNPVYIKDIQTYNRYYFIKCVNISLNSISSIGAFYGFTIFQQMAMNSTNSTQIFYKFIKDDPNANSYTIHSVTLVILLQNPKLYHTTSQFSNLNILVKWEYAQSGSLIALQNYTQIYQSNLLVGYSEFSHLSSTNGANIDYLLVQNILKLTATSTDGRIKYLAIQFVDYNCPESALYKYKGQKLCYTCQTDRVIIVTDERFNQYNQNISDQKCKRISTLRSGYAYNKITGRKTSVCAYCLQCTSQQFYLQNGKCIECANKILNCMQCQNNGSTCKTCQTGYNLVSNQCKVIQTTSNPDTTTDQKPIYPSVQSSSDIAVWIIVLISVTLSIVMIIGLGVLVFYCKRLNKDEQLSDQKNSVKQKIGKNSQQQKESQQQIKDDQIFRAMLITCLF